ncbi:GPI-anchored protein LLG1-like isoform X2 [Chenopodium quinoa]|uniref:GPI-anchored protein LLG1-like isoform X2 n=1 Tax=Chenopodium quinoa TaxID=63459 RepID=UPI000B78ABE6|nr:GPI-anchored protein LLG1-like isoform X2 [Chenopodium quinoa]
MFPVFSSMLKREKTQSAEKMVREVDVHSSNLFPPIILLLLLLASASATDQLHPCLSIARTLLQAQQGCPVNFEILNYTIITSRCKGPKYPPNICCEAFKDFACPYADQLNDQTNNCATTLFSYINLYGHYPPGLFANECRDTKRGLECTQSQSSPHHDAPAPSAAAIPTIFHHWIYLLSLLFSYRLFIS